MGGILVQWPQQAPRFVVGTSRPQSLLQIRNPVQHWTTLLFETRMEWPPFPPDISQASQQLAFDGRAGWPQPKRQSCFLFTATAGAVLTQVSQLGL